ncbi:MAG: hypothetical protein JWO41_51 [Candidatus Saccharibacteria bacterium]|nr:hypothetical protein [Candidatus Saccharibacteria bacterium]
MKILKKSTKLKEGTDEQSRINVGSFTVPKHISLAQVIVAAVILLGLAVAVALGHPFGLFASNKVCTIQELDSANTAIYKEDIPTLKNIADDIVLKKRYAADPNCLYIVLKSAIYRGDYNQASTTFALLSKAYKPNRGFSTEFRPVESMHQLSVEMSGLQAQHKELIKNSFGAINP